MALKFFRQRDIERMDAQDIPEEFVNYFETLDDISKEAMVGSRPDLAKALGFVLPKTVSKEVDSDPVSESVSVQNNEEIEQDKSTETPLNSDISDEEFSEELKMVSFNYYEGKDLDETLVTNMPELEALAIPDGATVCMLHRKPLESKQINYKKSGTSTYGLMVKICRDCHRVFLEESKMLPIHEVLMNRGIPHTFYDLDLSTQYLHSQMLPYEFSVDDVLWTLETWVEEAPKCPIHVEDLYEVLCLKKYKDREIQFSAYACDRCEKLLMRRTAALDLLDRCASAGIPQIEIKRLKKKKPTKKSIPLKNIKSDYIIEDGKKLKFDYTVGSNCYQLSEKDTVIVSDSIYCSISSHYDTEEVVALIWVLEKHGDKKAYLFHLGYCADCQKYYMEHQDYKVLYAIGRPEVTILRDIDDDKYYITSGEVFNLEREHLGKVEKQIDDEVGRIINKSDYVSPYATGYYDDGILGHAKYVSKTKYSKQLEQLGGFSKKPYSYRVDISLDDTTETYYIGISDIFLDGKQQVISANSDFGHELINYQTIKIQKDGKDYNIKLSRQFEIDNASLYGYTNLRTDEDIIFKSGITDPFLVRVLNMRKRQHNLTDIFVTIQENQNRIVNSPFLKNIIVQGCAGSGKTMVLLHRLSSLNYKQKNFNFCENALILTPNDQFTLHINGLAENLQIGNIRRCSVEQYYIELLQLYNPDFKLDSKISTEMIVNQNYVDYIYSDQFGKEYTAAYTSVIEKRNSLITNLQNLLKTMGYPKKNIDTSDDSKVVQQIKDSVDAIGSLVERKDFEIEEAVDEYQKSIDRKKYLQKRVRTLEKASSSIVRENIPLVYTKIGTFLSERQHIMAGMEERIKALKSEKENIQAKRFIFGKQARIEDLEEQIQDIVRKLDIEKKRQEDELPVLSQSTKDFNEDEALNWMRQVMLYVPDVMEEVRTCISMQEEYKNLSEELALIDISINSANEKVQEKKASRYPVEVKKTISDLRSELDKYSTIGTFQRVFDQATKSYRQAHNINNIRGKYHRYDLYAMLLFSLRYYGKAPGTTQFMCVDEGQDLALNEYYLLYALNNRRMVFNVFGDTNQLIKPERGISDWSELQKVFEAEKYELNENYRNTNQITRFCNSSFGMNMTLTGVDGVNVREISRKELESELASVNINSERIAILVPRKVQKGRYLKKEILPSSITNIIGETIDNGFISLMYVDEVKGIEFDKAYVVVNKMSQNEKYIAYTRALSELILVVDEQIEDLDNKSTKKEKSLKAKPKAKTQIKKKKKGSGVLNYKAGKNKIDTSRNEKDEIKNEEDLTEKKDVRQGNIAYEKQFIESGLNAPENWKGDPRGRFETMFTPLIEGSEYYFKKNTTDSSSKILELYKNDDQKRIMGFSGKRNMTINVFFNAAFCDYIRKSVALPENRNPSKSQPHMTLLLNKLWNVICVATGKPEFKTED